MLKADSSLRRGSIPLQYAVGYRLFNFWLPIPLYVIFYPGLRKPGRRERLS
jgi:uncharacterized membrane protein YbhN (UPF0104 family)